MLNKALLSLEENFIPCCADKDSYLHDGCADKGRYRHDSRADKNPYRHDRCADSLSPFLRIYSQTCLVLSILRIFYAFGVHITHYESL